MEHNCWQSHPLELDTQYLLTIPAFREFYRSDQSDAPAETLQQVPPSKATPEEAVEVAYNNAQAVLRAELLDRILQNSPSFFEHLIVDLLVAMGYGGSHKNASRQLGRSGDGGVDGVINEDVLGLDRVYVQAKCYSPGSSVGRPENPGIYRQPRWPGSDEGRLCNYLDVFRARR